MDVEVLDKKKSEQVKGKERQNLPNVGTQIVFRENRFCMPKYHLTLFRFFDSHIYAEVWLQTFTIAFLSSSISPSDNDYRTF